MIIILDASAYCSDFWIRGSNFEVLRGYLQRHDTKLVVSQIVLSEIQTIFQETVRDGLEKAKTITHRFLPYDISNIIGDDESKLVADYRKFIKAWHDKVGAELLPMPNMPLDEIVDRDLKRMKPFSKEGKKGSFRDYLIWSDVVRTAKTFGKPVSFISSNLSDFADEKKNKLHEDLASDLEKEGLDRDSVKFHPSLKSFIEKVIVPILKTIELTDGNTLEIKIDVEDWVRKALSGMKVEFSSKLEAFRFQWLSEMINATFGNVTQIYTDYAKRLENEEILVSVAAECELKIQLGYGEDIGEEKAQAFVEVLLTLDKDGSKVLTHTVDYSPLGQYP